ncbi:hypothetical protein MRY82_07750 [bacterium]|nr:hypothetical protein [bacterium]
MDKNKKISDIDLELLKENLSLSVEERLKKHADALYLLETLESYKHTLSDEK